jgi:signal transduction histidine kinase/ActR/RegA family two-component response regulator
MTTNLRATRMPQAPRSSSLYNRILTAMAIIFLLMAVFIASGVLLLFYRNENQFWQERQTEAANNAASRVADYIERNEAVLYWLDRFGFNEMLADPAAFRTLLLENPAFLEIAFLDAGGNLLLSAAQNEPVLANQFTVKQSQWFRTARAGKKTYTRIQTSPKGESYLIFAMPSQQGGVVVAQIKMDGLWQKVAGITFGKSGTVYVVSQEGQVIAHRNPQYVLENRSIGDTLQFKSILKASGNDYAGDGENLDGVKVKSISTRIEPTGWIVIAELPRKEANAVTSRALIFIPFGLILLMGLSAVVFRKILVVQFLRPVELLRAGAIRLSKGDLAFRHDVSLRRDELGQVMEVFNNMAAELAGQQAELQKRTDEIASAYKQIQTELLERRKAQAALKDLNDELERRVQERTVSLVQSNKDLLHEIAERRLAEEQRQQLETQLQQAHKMEAIGTLAGGIAHDFNNILGVILGNAEMARGDAGAGTNLADDLDEVIKACHRARELVKQILAFSRQADSERIALQPAKIVREAMRMLRSSIPSTIDIHQDIDSSTESIMADPTHIHQILMNLCTNAFHAMEKDGGRIDIRLQDVEIGAEDLEKVAGDIRPGRYIQLTVADSGPGIDHEVRKRMFDPYFTTKEVGKGTGLGLSIVHGIVMSYNGFITYISDTDQNSVFYVYLPVIEDIAVQTTGTAETLPVGEERILFVDDEKMLAGMGKKMLEKLGYAVTAITDSRDALKMFQEKPDQFDLVITDQTMPGLTGIDLCRQMLEIRPDLPLILCTGYSTLVSEDTAKAAGVREFILKPLAKKDLALLIRKALDSVL